MRAPWGAPVARGESSYTPLSLLLHSSYTPLTYLHSSYTALTLLLHSSYTPLTQPARMHVLTACMHVVATRRLPSHTARTAPSVQALTQLDGGAARAARGSGGAARLALELPELHGLAAALGRSQQPPPREYGVVM